MKKTLSIILVLISLNSFSQGSNPLWSIDRDTIFRKIFVGDSTTKASIDSVKPYLVFDSTMTRAQRAYNAFAVNIPKAEPLLGANGYLDIHASFSLTSGQVIYTIVEVSKPSVTMSGIMFYRSVGGTYIGTNAGTNGLAIYSLNSGTGDMTLIDSTATDSTFWKSTSGWLTKSFSGGSRTYTKGYYVLACLYNRISETTAPSITGFTGASNTYLNQFPWVNNIKSNSVKASQTSWALTLNFSTTTSSPNQPYWGVY